ncbi:MAG: ASCH domain-containing protein [Candidatus Gastranaerophilaceae bacterium]
MPEIHLKRVLAGVKKSVISKGILEFHPGMLVLMSEDKTLTKTVCVKRVEIVKFSEITDKEAKLMSYSSAKVVRDMLERVYGPCLPEEFFTIVEWV